MTVTTSYQTCGLLEKMAECVRGKGETSTEGFFLIIFEVYPYLPDRE